MAALHAADDIAMAVHEPGLAAEARAEIGYVDFLRARYDRAELWLTDARTLGTDSLSIVAKTETYLGSTESDRGNYPQALQRLEAAVEAARRAGEVRLEAFALSMLGRIHLLRHNFDEAARSLDLSLELCARSHLLALVPWPQAWRGPDAAVHCGQDGIGRHYRSVMRQHPVPFGNSAPALVIEPRTIKKPLEV